MIFASPLFLIGLVAVAIPIVVHLFNFRRYKKVYFSNVEKLEQMQTETRRQSNLRQLLILVTRILAVVFLVLAFAQPYIPSREGVVVTGGTDVSIFIDNSFSMGSSDGSTTLMEKAKSKAREIVAAYAGSDRFQLLTCDAEGVQFHWLSKDDVLIAIDGVEPSSATMTVASVARRQSDFLRSGSGENKHAYIISDFQQTIADIAEFPDDSTVSTTFVPLESVAQNNVFIDSLSFGAPMFFKGSSVTAEVWLMNEGEENLEKVPVSLYIGERERAIAAVDLAANSRTSVEMHFTIDETGILQGRVETNDYPVTFDDSYYFSLNIREHVRMLSVEGGQENEYLRRLFGDDPSVDYTSVSIKQMDFSRIEDNDIVLLDGLQSIGTGMAQGLHTFVEGGGTLVIVLGEKIDEASYNEALGLFSAPRVEGLNSSRVAAGVVHTEHILYRNVFAASRMPSQDMEMPTVGGYYRLTGLSTSLRQPVITLVSGDDYIVSTPCGLGMLYIVAAPLSDAHTDFVKQALFVPTFYNMALYSVRLTSPAVMLDREEPVLLGSSYEQNSGTVRLVSAGGVASRFEQIPDIRTMGGNSYLVPHGDIREAGNYLLQKEDNPVEGLSFNYSRSESVMQFVSRSELTRLLSDYNLRQCSVIRNVDKPLDSYLRQRMEGHRLWHWCVMFCLLMLLIETILLRWKDRSQS